MNRCIDLTEKVVDSNILEYNNFKNYSGCFKCALKCWHVISAFPFELLLSCFCTKRTEKNTTLVEEKKKYNLV